MRSIMTRTIPPERRPRILVQQIEDRSDQVGNLVLAAICLLTLAVGLYGRWMNPIFRTSIIQQLRNLLPRATRKPCRS
jgi:hypothetical protein